MMNFKKRSLIFITFFVSCFAIALLAASLGTQYWVKATCHREGEFREKSNGTVNFGLFQGSRHLNSGLGDRYYEMNMLKILYRERTFLLYELYISTIALVSSGILFGILSSMLSIVNTAYNPVEAICHIPGLYLTNLLALLVTLSAVITWIVQFYVKLYDNVLIREDRDEGKWSSKGEAMIGYSFWLAVIACVCFVANMVIIAIATRDPYENAKTKRVLSLPGKQAGDTMLY